MSNRSIAGSMVGESVRMPVALAPTGLTGMQHADGEILAARAAESRMATEEPDRAFDDPTSNTLSAVSKLPSTQRSGRT